MTITPEAPPPGHVAATSLAVLVSGVVSALVIVNDGWRSPSVAGLVIGCLLLLYHVRPMLSVAKTGNVEVLTFDDVLYVPMLAMLAPFEIFAITALASITGALIVHRPVVKSVFNLGAHLLACALAIMLAKLVGVTPSVQPDLRDVIGAMLGALAYTAATALLVRAMVSYATRTDYLKSLRDVFDRVRPWGGAIVLGGVATLAVGTSPWAAVLGVIMVAFVQSAYAAVFREISARMAAERLQRATGSLRAQQTSEAVVDDLVRAARDLTAAEKVTVLEGDEHCPNHALTVRLGSERVLCVEGRHGSGPWTADDRAMLKTLAGVAGDVLRTTELIAQLRTITYSQSEGVIAVDLNARVTFANPAAVKMTGHEFEDQLLGQRIDDVCALKQGTRPTDFAKMVADEAVERDVDAILLCPGVSSIDVAYSLTPLRTGDSHQTHTGAVLVLRDITERRALQNAMAHRALHDELTGLPNRRLLTDRLDHALARLVKSGGEHGVLFVDLDRFKLVNDSYGHLVGDRLLIQVAHRLRRSVSAADTVARFSGDEFVMLVEDVPGVEQLEQIAQRVHRSLEAPFDLGEVVIHVSASVGVAAAQASQAREDVLAAADTAAYAAKAAGGNCVRMASDDLIENARERLDLEGQLRKAIEDEQLSVHFQPIVSTDEGRVVGVEALVRWHNQQRGVVMPNQFIPLAEETGLIVPLGRWVLKESCRAVQAWTRAHPEREPLNVSVNLSAVQFSSPALADEVAACLAQTGLAPSQLCLEITESALMADTATTLRTLHALRELGVRVAIDDFGTGYSSLSYLKHLPVDVVKLDGSFTAGLDQGDPVDAEIVGAVLRLSYALGMETVAEGVETEAQRQRLGEMGCPLMQGYLTSRPLQPEAFLEFWTQRTAITSAPVPEPGLAQR
ncbi:MAG TPA: EAL domain-containing protein [Nocardioidaceae bacterium]|nr:EAL domain-containing protein [Nocardioidaceae bacterium]